MNVFIGLIIIMVLGFLGAHLTEYAKRFSLALQTLITLGAGFLFVGLLIGPQVSGIITNDALQELSPVMSLGLGWFGLLVGIQFDRQLTKQISLRNWLTGIIISLITIVILFTGFFALGYWQKFVPVFPIGFCLCLACSASLSNYSAMALIKNINSARGGIVKHIQLLTDIRAPIAIILMALWYCIDAALLDEALNRSSLQTGFDFVRRMTAMDTETLRFLLQQGLVWIVVSLMMGVALGWMLHYLTSERLQPNEMLLVLTGAVLLSSGLAASLHLSPLFINFLMGATLTNLPNFARGRVSNRLMRTERPFFIVFMIFIGALWTPLTWFVLLLALFYCILRFLALFFSVHTARFLFEPNGSGKRFPLHWSMISQGGMSLAIVADYYIIQTGKYAGLTTEDTLQDFYTGEFTKIALNIMIVSLLLNQIIGANTMRSMLYKTGAIKTNSRKQSLQHNTKPSEVTG